MFEGNGLYSSAGAVSNGSLNLIKNNSIFSPTAANAGIDLMSPNIVSALSVPEINRCGMSSEIADAHEDYVDSGYADQGVSFAEYVSAARDPNNEGRLQEAIQDIINKHAFEDVFNGISVNKMDPKDPFSSTGLTEPSSQSSANDRYLELYESTGDPAFLEKYIDNLIEQENVQSARDYETMMSNTSFSRLVEDIKNSGYNPWLALQSSMNTTSTPSVAPAGSSSLSYSEQQTSKRNNDQNVTAGVWERVISLFGTLVLAFALMG